MTLRLPETELATIARTHTARFTPDFLLAHSERSYLFGRALLGEVDIDEEAGYLAALFHDAGLTDRYPGAEPFEIRSAAAATEFLREYDVHGERAQAIVDGITLHLDPATAAKEPQIALVHLGSAADVVGLRLDELPPGLVEDVVAAYPRHDMKRRLIELFEREIANNPTSQLAALERRFGLRALIASAPFAE